MRPFVLDCDTGRDDALALWLALQTGMPLVGVVASYGNTILENVVDNTARVLALAGGGEIPLCVGAREPSRSHQGIQDVLLPRQQAAGNGLCHVEFPAAPRQQHEDGVAMIRDLAAKHGALDYVIMGSATHFASLCVALGDKLRHCIGRVTMMGGKFDPLWSVAPVADFNLVCDPFAVRTILAEGLVPRFVPLNVTWPIALGLSEIEALVPQSEIAQAAQQLMVAYCRHFAPDGIFRFHDPCVLLALAAPENFSRTMIDIVCEEGHLDFARLQMGVGGFPAEVYSADTTMQEGFLKTLLAALGFSTQSYESHHQKSG